MTAPPVDVHQRVWPAPLVAALRARTRAPRLVGWTLYLDGEPPSEGLPGQRVTLSRTRLSTGATRRFDGRHVHEVVNDGPVPAVTVHAYAPALDSMSRYRLESGILTLATSECAGDDW